MTTYRQHQDTRDGRIYNCVLMPDGKWWSAEDYRWDGSEWISPRNDWYWDATLAAARLYRRSTLTIPPGAHLPTATEWTAMGAATGTLSDSKPLRSTSGWGPAYAGPDTYGFGIIAANGSPIPLAWGSTGFTAMLLSANGVVQTVGGSPGLSIDNIPTPDDYYGSVRFIVDVFNEPIPKPSDFFPPPGTYDNPITVTLNKSGMRYTLDGTDPTETSPFLDAPLRISGPTEIRLKSDAMPTVYAFAYLIKGRALPMYKQAVLWADGKTSPESITRTYHG